MQRQQTSAVNEVIASILIVALVIALAVIIGGIVFGLIVIQPKSAYIPPEVKVVSYPNGTPQAISLYSRSGDTAYLDKGDNVQYALGVYVDRSEGSFRAMPDTGTGTFNPGQTLYVYWDDPVYRITNNSGSIGSVLPNGQLTLRIVDENAKLLVYNQGMTITGGGTAVPTPTCTLGTGWIITNPNNIDTNYRLSYQPGGIVVREGTIQASSMLIIWSSYYQETGGSPHRLRTLSGPYQNQQTSAKTTSKLWCQFTDIYETYTSGSPGMLLLDPYE